MANFAEIIPKAKQIGTGVAAGGTTLLFVMNMLGARIDEMNKRFEEVNKRMDEKDVQLREFVNFKDSAAIREMKYLRDGQAEMKELLKALQLHQYRQTKPHRGD